MKKLNYTTLCLLAIVSLSRLYATPVKTIETVQEQPVTKASVENQINHLLITSTAYKDFKLIKASSLEELKFNLKDFLSKADQDLRQAKEALVKQSKHIENSKFELLELKSKLNAINEGGGEIGILGLSVPENVYHASVWSLMGFLLLLTVVVIRKFKLANELVLHSRGQLSDLEEEFNTYKQSAIEREMKIQRQLLNEISKQQKLAPDVS